MTAVRLPSDARADHRLYGSEQIDPRDLTPALRTALATIHDHTPHRAAGGYGRFPGSFVALKTSQRMIHLQLARVDHSARGSRLMLTGKGINTYTVMMSRRDRRAGR